MTTAKIFMSGRSQAVRLPKEFRFDCAEVYIRRDTLTGEIILSQKPVDWNGLFELDATTEVPEEFMTDADRKQSEQLRDPFEGWEE